MTDPKKSKPKRKTTRVVKPMTIDVAVSLSPEAEDLLKEVNKNLYDIGISLRKMVTNQDGFTAVVGPIMDREMAKVDVKFDDTPSLWERRSIIFDDISPRCDEHHCDICDTDAENVVWHLKKRWCRDCYIRGEDIPDAPEIGTCTNCGHTIEKVPGTNWKVCGECHHPEPEDP